MSHRWECGIKIPTGGWSALLKEWIPADVVWTGETNLTATGNDLEKTGGGSAWDDNDAQGDDTIAADGYVEAQLGADSCIGLNDGAAPSMYAEDYAIVWSGGTLYVFENSVQKYIAGYDTSPLARVQRVGTTVTFWADGVLVYTSETAPAATLTVGAHILHVDGVITDAVVADTGAGTTVTLTAAKTYYHSSAGNDTLDLPARLAALLSAAATGTYTVAVDAGASGTGRYTIAADLDFSLAWTSAALGTLLGYDEDLGASGIAATYTSAGAGKCLWLPSSGNGSGIPLGVTAIGDDLDETDASEIGTPDSSNVTRFSYHRRGINAVDYQACLAARTRIAYETYANESWQQFWRDCIDGDLSAQIIAVARVRIYTDANDDDTYYDYWVRGMFGSDMEALVKGWQGAWTVRFPRLERVG